MNGKGPMYMKQCYVERRFQRHKRKGSAVAESGSVLVECYIEVYLNDCLTYRIVCSPIDIELLVIGRLYSDGHILDASDVHSIDISEAGDCVRVTTLARDEKVDLAEQPIIITSSDSGFRREEINDDERIQPAFYWESDWIYKLVEEFGKEAPIYRHTRGAHSCFLARGGEIICAYEDIGRHNALDKAIGRVVIEKLDFSTCILFVSGRLPVDMVKKVAACKIPLIASNTVPTAQSIEWAQKFGITLIGRARKDEFYIFNDNGRKADNWNEGGKIHE